MPAERLDPDYPQKGVITMRFLCIAKSDEKTEAGVLPDPAMFATMGAFVAEQQKAGILLSTEGLHPSSRAARVRMSNGKLSVTDGPFTEAKEVIASFALIKVNSKQEAIENVGRFLSFFGEGEADIYQVYDAEDFASQDQSPCDVHAQGACAATAARPE
jgi:hypothetical protein